MRLYWAANLLTWGVGNDTLQWGEDSALGVPKGGHVIQVIKRAPRKPRSQPTITVKKRRTYTLPEDDETAQAARGVLPLAPLLPDVPMPSVDLAPIRAAIGQQRAQQAQYAQQMAQMEQARAAQAVQAAQQQAAAQYRQSLIPPTPRAGVQAVLEQLRRMRQVSN